MLLLIYWHSFKEQYFCTRSKYQLVTKNKENFILQNKSQLFQIYGQLGKYFFSVICHKSIKASKKHFRMDLCNDHKFYFLIPLSFPHGGVSL